jgi:hypothetical protein
MLKKSSSVKSIIYLSILSIVLVFSLYNLFSEDARSWFAINKIISVNPVYGRVLTSGAGRNLSSFKNNDAGNLNLIIVEESGDETATIRMVPGDIVHFVFLVSVADPSIFDNSTLVLNGIYGDDSLRNDCTIKANDIKVSSVAVTVDNSSGTPVYNYEHSETWQTLANSAVSTLYTTGNELSIDLGVSNVTGTPVDTGAYAGTYLFLVDVPALYKDTGVNQNYQKCAYETTTGGIWVPVQGTTTGTLIIERCIITKIG